MQLLRTRLSALLMVLAASSAFADDGLQVPDAAEAWPRWQARIGIAAAPLRAADLSLASAPRWRSALLLGDYYFAGPAFGEGRVTGGFRATSGVLFGPRGTLLATPALAGGGTQPLSVTLSSRDTTAESTATAPYLGIGYTGLSARGGWGFTADVGLLAVNGSGLRVGPAMQSIDDLMRDLRLSPVLQLGVSYSF